MNCFLDLDGTVIDSRKRLYTLFRKLVPQAEYSMDDYWTLKKEKIGHEEILRKHFLFSEADFADFNRTWHHEIEKPEWLALDTPIAGVKSYLESLRNRNLRLFLVTARQSEKNTLQQLADLELHDLFDGIWVTRQMIDKTDLIRERAGSSLSPSDWVVGDTGKDIQTGKTLGIRTAAVLSGFLSRASLEPYSPDEIVDDITRFNPQILAHGTEK